MPRSHLIRTVAFAHLALLLAGCPWLTPQPPAEPQSALPGDARVNPLSAALDWLDAARATSYDVYFGAESPPPFVGTTTESTWVLDALAYDTTYYWQIVALNAAGQTPGPVWSFTTEILIPGVPATPTPPDGATNAVIEIDLDWADTAWAESYEVHFGVASPPPLVGTTSESAWVLDTLVHETTYHWQIVAKNSIGDTPGPIWSFTTQDVHLAIAVQIATVPVGNPDNMGELSGQGAGGMGPDRICGEVARVYDIGKYEVTAGQYTVFLNAMAAADAYGLYNPDMWSDPYGCRIERSGAPGSYTYSVAPDWADRPVNYVSWADAARFCNWLHNGQPTGVQNLNTTEDGSYLLDGATSNAALVAVVRGADATWVIPTEDEWYKAAYHKNDGMTENYFDYPAADDSAPGNDLTDPDVGHNATYYISPGDYTIGSPYYRTAVGEFENSASPYGTFDMGGNVWEWNEEADGELYGVRGGAHSFDGTHLHAARRDYSQYPVTESNAIGFRVAEVVPPGPLGACCYSYGTCLVRPEADCAGVWHGAGTTCAPNPCVATPLVIETITVGNPGNVGELSGEGAGGMGPDRVCGAVGYIYNIGKYEVTAGQYTKFLNAVAANDTYGLYSPDMWSDTYDHPCRIQRRGSPGSYMYSVAPDWANRPVNYVSWGDAARFCNWLHNGQPTGAQGPGTTEEGSYALNGATSGAALLAIVREPDATWVIPTEDEWYKAAYHKNDGATGNYWDYPTGTDELPSNDVIDPDPGNNANYHDSGYSIGSPYYRTEVGEFENSESPYGTFDQAGNVREWNEAVTHGAMGGPFRGMRGGSHWVFRRQLPSSFRMDAFCPTTGDVDFGLRVVELP